MINIQLLYEMMESITDAYDTSSSILNFPPDKSKTLQDFKVDDFVKCSFSSGHYAVIGYSGNKVAVRNLEKGYFVTIGPANLTKIECPNELFKHLYGKK